MQFVQFGKAVCFYCLFFVLRKMLAIPDVDISSSRAVSSKDSSNWSVIFRANSLRTFETGRNLLPQRNRVGSQGATDGHDKGREPIAGIQQVRPQQIGYFKLNTAAAPPAVA
jgi:hypothetical protein